MRKCPTCGRENPADARFCSACGSRLVQAEPLVREERKIVSVLFADLVGFTARSESLDPEDVRAIQSPYFQRVRAEIEGCGGTVEKFIGDAVMGVFGAPVAHGDDPERAVRAALGVRDGIAQLNTEHPELELQVRVAVNTGEAIVTLDADASQGEGLVAGDVVNTASRLQGLAPVNGVLVGEETYRATKRAIDYRPVDPVSLKGKTAPVPAWIALAASTAPGERRAQGLPIVGREHELDVLRRIWEQVVAEGRPHVVTVFGTAGIGKTRLAGEFAELVEDGGGRALRGRSVPYGEKTIYGAFAQHVKQMTGIFDSDEGDEAWAKLREASATLLGTDEAAEVAQHVGSLLGLEREGTAARREDLFYSARRLVEEVARRQPTVLVFEDLQWADAATLELVESLAARVREVPLLLLALARPELLEQRPAWGGGLPGYTALPLEPLGAAQAEELASHALAAARAVGFDTRAIAATAEGNPLFIEELAASLLEQPANGDAELPTSIRALVAARLDGLPAEERAVLLDASVVGKVFWRGALEAMSSGGEALGRLLDSLEARDLVRREPVSRLAGEQQFIFKHILIRDTAYATLPRPARRDRHAAVARFLEEKTHDGLAAASALAQHWLEAGDDRRAADFLVVAGDQAGRGWAKDEAVAYYRQALALLPEDERERRREITRRQAVAIQAHLHRADAELLGRRAPGAQS
jgi:class 3 adenylate cyclase